MYWLRNEGKKLCYTLLTDGLRLLLEGSSLVWDYFFAPGFPVKVIGLLDEKATAGL